MHSSGLRRKVWVGARALGTACIKMLFQDVRPEKFTRAVEVECGHSGSGPEAERSLCLPLAPPGSAFQINKTGTGDAGEREIKRLLVKTNSRFPCGWDRSGNGRAAKVGGPEWLAEPAGCPGRAGRPAAARGLASALANSHSCTAAPPAAQEEARTQLAALRAEAQCPAHSPLQIGRAHV